MLVGLARKDAVVENELADALTDDAIGVEFDIANRTEEVQGIHHRS